MKSFLKFSDAQLIATYSQNWIKEETETAWKPDSMPSRSQSLTFSYSRLQYELAGTVVSRPTVHLVPEDQNLHSEDENVTLTQRWLWT